MALLDTVKVVKRFGGLVAVNKMDFSFFGVVDMHPIGRRVEGSLVVSVVSPLAELGSENQDFLQPAPPKALRAKPVK